MMMMMMMMTRMIMIMKVIIKRRSIVEDSKVDLATLMYNIGILLSMMPMYPKY